MHQVAISGGEGHAAFLGDCLEVFVGMLDAPQAAVVRAGWSAFDATLKTLAKERLLLHVGSLREALKAGADRNGRG